MSGPAVPQTGERLGPYELLSPLGVGGMSEVHRARDTRLGREVAIKRLDFEAARQPERLRLFEQEARAASAVNHPAIVGVHDVGREGDVPYVVFELVEGETLQQRLARGRLPQRRAVEIAIQVAHGLAAAHARGILHNDLKPANLILTRDGRVKILDFGLAGLRGGSLPDLPLPEERATLTQALFGTAGYIAPERIEGAPPDARSDLFSLGAVLYEMLAGVPAFAGSTTTEILGATAEQDPPVVDPPLPPALDRIVRRALEKHPDQRFQSASDLAYALDAVSPLASPQPQVPAPARRRPLLTGVAVALGALALVAAGVAIGRRLWHSPVPSFQRLTFRYGAVSSARFAADGRTVVYSAAWEGEPRVRLWSARTDTRGSSDLGLADGDVAAVSSTGELAFFPGRPYPALYQAIMGPGETLARVPITGGAPREVLPDVVAADWSPSASPEGPQLALVRDHQGLRRLEFPVGHVLYQTSYGLRAPRFSPDGSRIAVFENGPGGDCVLVIDLAGRRTVLADGLTFTSSALAWSKGGGEVWFSAEKLADGPRYGSWRPALRAVSVGGRERVVLRLPDFLSLQDVTADGRVLLTVGTMRSEVIGRPAGEPQERNLSWHEGSSYTEMSRDGRQILFFEAAELATYLRPTDGGPALRLCEGLAAGLSPDGRWVVRIGMDQYSGRVLLVPTQAGEPRPLVVPRIAPWAVQWFHDGRRLLMTGNEQGRPLRAWVVSADGAEPRAITPEGVGCWLVSPDDRSVACARPEAGEGYLYPVDGGGPRRPIPGFGPGDHMRQWSEDGRSLFVSERYARPARVLRLDLHTGERRLWRELGPSSSAGIVGTIDPAITPDGSAWAYSVLHHLNDLYLVEGLQ